MVRINIIHPKNLADQHLIAEYNEILMLLGYVNKFPNLDEIPLNYKLGKGHIKFFKNKLSYLKERHDKIKKEMLSRNFKPTKEINLSNFKRDLQKNWTPKKEDKEIIKRRLIEKISLKPEFYTYYGEHKPLSFFESIIKKAD